MLVTAGDVSIPDGMNFTLDSELNAEVPQFTLTCVSTGGPATTVTWTRDSEPVSGGMTALDDPVTAQYTHTLTVTGRLGGLYQCTVSNNKPSQAMVGLMVQGTCSWTCPCKCWYPSMRYTCKHLHLTHVVAAAPSGIVGIANNGTSIDVSWTPPSPLGQVTGYRIYYDGDDGSSGYVDVTGSSSRRHILTRLPSDVAYIVSITALSTFLHSEVVFAQNPIRLGNYDRLLPLYSVQFCNKCSNSYCSSVLCYTIYFVGDVSIPDGMSFILDSELNAEVPQFTLTCVSTGGPATTVTWTRDSEPVSGGMTVLDDPVTAQYTHTLTVTGRLGGLYQCTVSNNKPSQAMAGLTVRSELSFCPATPPFRLKNT